MKDNISKIRTVCRKCQSIVEVSGAWGFNSCEYTCRKCGYSTLDSDKVEKIKEGKNDK